jgi:hypothetical protein
MRGYDLPSGDGNADFARTERRKTMGMNKWSRVGPAPRIGPVQFRDDGGFQVVGTETVFDRSNRLVDCRVAGVRFDYYDGKARLENDIEIHDLRFVGEEGWEHFMVNKGGVRWGWWLFAGVGVTMGLAWCFFR